MGRYKYSWNRAKELLDAGVLTMTGIARGVEQGLIEPSPADKQLQRVPESVRKDFAKLRDEVDALNAKMDGTKIRLHIVQNLASALENTED